MKKIDEVVTNCGSCPFHETLDHEVVVQDAPTLSAGHWCLHRNNRGCVATMGALDMTGARGVNDHFRKIHGVPFPPNCPLRDETRATTPTGRRDVDLD